MIFSDHLSVNFQIKTKLPIIEVKKALHRDLLGTGLAEVRLAPKAVTVIFVQAHHNSFG